MNMQIKDSLQSALTTNRKEVNHLLEKGAELKRNPNAPSINSYTSSPKNGVYEINYLLQEHEASLAVLRSTLSKGGALESQAAILSGIDSNGIVASNGTSELRNAVDAFFNQARSASTVLSHDLNSFIQHGEKVCSTMNNLVDQIKSARSKADMAISTKTGEINDLLRTIFENNRSISRANVSDSYAIARLQSNNSEAITKLSDLVDVQHVQCGTNGKCSKILVGPSGYSLVDDLGYVQLKYSPYTGNMPLDENNYNPIIAESYDSSSSNKPSNSEEVAVFSGDQRCNIFGDGAIKGLIDLRDKILPESGTKVKKYMKVFADKINEFYRDYTPANSSDGIIGTAEVLSKDIFELSQNPSDNIITVSAFDPNRSRLMDNGRITTERKIDLSKIRPDGSSPTNEDVINEMNNIFNSRNNVSAAMGKIFDDKGTALTENLINNIQLRARSIPVPGVDDSFSFDLDLQGNAYFGSKVLVSDAWTATGPNDNTSQHSAPDKLPPSFSLEKGVSTTTGQTITVSGATAGRYINIRVWVLGENGISDAVNIAYKIPDPATLKINSRIAPDQNQWTGEDEVALKAPYRNIAVFDLQNPDGSSVLGSNFNKGVLSVKNSSSSINFSIAGGKFLEKFKANNMFLLENENITLDSKITDNPESLCVLKPQALRSQKKVTLGDQKATTTINFVGPAGATFTAGDKVTVAGVRFIFANPAINKDQVALGVDVKSGIENLVKAINDHPLLKDFVTATSDGVGKLTIESLAPGEFANTYDVKWNLGAGSRIKFNTKMKDKVTLAGGTNKTEDITLESSLLDGSAAGFFNKLSTLSEKAVQFDDGGSGTLISGIRMYAEDIVKSGREIKDAYDIVKTAVAAAARSNREATGTDDDMKFTFEALMLQHHSIVLAQMLQKTMENTEKILDIIMR